MRFFGEKERQMENQKPITELPPEFKLYSETESCIIGVRRKKYISIRSR